MYKSLRWLIAALAIEFCLLGAACAEVAEDITQACIYNGGKGSSIKDASYRTVWESSRKNGRHVLTIEAPEGQTIGGLLIRWNCEPLALKVEIMDDTGEWRIAGECEADFLAQYIPVDGHTAVRLMERETDGNIRLEISSITVLTPGDLPDNLQLWQKAGDKVDLMLLATHPDDEVLWFGGLLPTYAGVRGKNVLVVNACHSREDRRLELLDCLWTCGVHTYPMFLGYPDICSNQSDKVLQRWKWERVLENVTSLYRQYRPDVVVLHAADGESGHGAHIVLSEAGRMAAEAAKETGRFEQSEQAYGLWDVSKVYMHKHAENQIQMDWHVPLEQFDGKTAFEVADLGFHCHQSQLGGEWEMKNGGKNDNSLFGLWYSAVGPDIEKNDLFENLP